MARVSRKAAVFREGKNCRAPGPERVYRAAAYVRLSLEENRRGGMGESLEMQQHMVEKYVQGQGDMRLQGVYRDNGETGTDFERPGFEEMMDRARKGEIDCIVVKDLSRFGRNYVEAGYYLEKVFPCLGVRFVAVNDSYDTAKDGDREEMILSLKNLINDLYAKDISQKICSSLDIKRKKGEYTGACPPYGYLKSSENRRKLEPDQDAAPVVARIFQWRADGAGIGQIVRRLNEEGIPSPALHFYRKGIRNREPSEAARLWKVQGVSRILENIVYVGHLAQGKTRKSLSEGIPQRDVSREEWIVVKNVHPPIVDGEIFEKVQRMAGQRCPQNLAVRAKGETEGNIFKGLLVCGDCGRKMVRHRNVTPKGTARYAFVCCVYEQNRGRRGCTKKYVREEDIQEAVSRFLGLQAQVLLDPEKRKIKSGGNEERELDGRIRRTEQKIKRNGVQERLLLEACWEGALTRGEYLSLKKESDRKARELQKELDEMQRDAAEYKARTISWEEWLTSLKRACLCPGVQAVTGGMALELIQSIRVSGYNDLEILWNYHESVPV